MDAARSAASQGGASCCDMGLPPEFGRVVDQGPVPVLSRTGRARLHPLPAGCTRGLAHQAQPAGHVPSRVDGPFVVRSAWLSVAVKAPGGGLAEDPIPRSSRPEGVPWDGDDGRRCQPATARWPDSIAWSAKDHRAHCPAAWSPTEVLELRRAVAPLDWLATATVEPRDAPRRPARVGGRPSAARRPVTSGWSGLAERAGYCLSAPRTRSNTVCACWSTSRVNSC
jgi:hypothetical protein